MKQISLLDYLSSATGCSYISDLRLREKGKEILKIVNTIPAQNYSVEEWKDTYQYITVKTSQENIESEIRNKLIEFLK